jgi:hypothetical protein
MNNPLLKKLLPHIIAIVVFIVVAALFCKPTLEGNVLNQDDVNKWKGIAQNSFDYKEKTGHFPLWNPNLFSGMPNYQIAMEGKSILPDMIKVLSLGLPKPLNFFFLACLGFYILCLALEARPVIAIFGGLAYAFSTYNAVVISAGHDTQMFATAFMPLLLSGLILTYKKKYWLGLAVTTLAAYLQVGSNHLQITYYFFLVAAAVTICYLIIWIRNKEWKHILIAGIVVVIGGLVGLAGNAMTLMTTAEYTKYTMRGGKSIDTQKDTVTAAKTSGLDTAYAFEYSLGKAESFTLLMPNAFGGGSYKHLPENSKVISNLVNAGVNAGVAQQLATEQLPSYWGELPFTAGPAYLGVFICLLGLIGFVVMKTPLRWGLLAVTLLGILLSWGKHFGGFNTFLFEHLPLYNKFRAPSMAQVIPQLTVTIIAIMALQYLLYNEKSKEILRANFKKILYATGGLFVLLGLMYLAMDYSAAIDSQIIQSFGQQDKSGMVGRAVVQGLKADRQAMFGGQLLRSLLFGVILVGLLYFYMKNKIQPIVVAVIILVIGSAELLLTSKDYLPNEKYVSSDDLQSEHFVPTPSEQTILNDKDPNFRVFNNGVNPVFDARNSSFFKSITGYHPARLRIYQDVLDRYLSQGNVNPAVLNMLNTKYFIASNPQDRSESVLPNPEAYGPCWLAKSIKVASGPVEEFLALKNNNLKDTVVVDPGCKANTITPDSSASIKMTNFDNDAIEYESNANSPQFAVFSEIYYPKGWNAYIDGKQTDYCKVNYLLRGLSVPAGKHTVKFVFEPASVKKGRSISFIASILIAIIFIGGIYMHYREMQSGRTQPKQKSPHADDAA